MGESAAVVATTALEIEGINFPATITPPESSKRFFLGGAGKRGLVVEGKFKTFTAIGVYLEENAVAELAGKWKGKNAEELAGSPGFFRDIVSGPFEKFTRITMVLPLTGQQYAEKVTENCVAIWKAMGVYTEAEAAAVEKFREVFKEEVFPHGSSILFTSSPSGLKIGFSKDGSIPQTTVKVIENRAISEAVLESIIGEHGVSRDARQSLAFRLSESLK